MENRETEDMYLKAIFLLQKDIGYTRSVDVANQVRRTKPTVSYTMKQLKTKGYVQMQDNGRIYLTNTGFDRAAFIYDAYQLLKNFLMKTGADEPLAEENACRMERLVSADVVDVIRNFLATNP